MLVASHRRLKILAALVWYVGGIVLLLKGSSLLVEAEALRPEQNWPWLAVFAGLFLGSLKAKYLFSRSCRKNLDRIAALEQPKLWQFYRPGFFAMLTLMILFGATLSKLAHNNYPFLISVGTLDLSLAIALLASSYFFWTDKTFGPAILR